MPFPSAWVELRTEAGCDVSGRSLCVLSSLRQWDDDLHVVDGEKAGLAVEHALVPVLVYLICEDDDVAFLEAQLAPILRHKVVEGATAWLVQHIQLVNTAIGGGALRP